MSIGLEKARIRESVLSVLRGETQAPYGLNQISHLEVAVAAFLYDNPESGRESRLQEPEATLFLEVYWDLVIEKKLTIGLNHANPNYPFFRIHSEAKL
jgi:hypothetical protein